MSRSDNPASWREAFAAYRQGLQLWRRTMPQMIPSIVIYQGISALTPYVSIWFSAQILNELSGNRDVHRLVRLVVVTLIVECLLSLIRAAARRWHDLWEEMRETRIEYAYAKKLRDMDFSILDRQSTYSQYTHLLDILNWAGYGLHHVAYETSLLAQGVVQLLGGVALTVGLFTSKAPFRGDWLDRLSHPLAPLAVLAMVTVIIGLSAYLDNRSNEEINTAAKSSTENNRVFNYFGYQMPKDRKRQMDIRAYEQAPICKGKISQDGWNGSWARWHRGRHGVLLSASWGVESLVVAPVYVFTGLKAWAGAFGIGSVTQYVSSTLRLSGGVSQIFYGLSEMRANTGFLQETIAFLNIPNEMYQGSLTTEKRSDRQYEVEFRDVSFRYPDTEAWALRHVNLKFQIGRRLAVVGENGSGKTTFIKLLCRLYDPTEGEILLNGINIRKYSYQDYLALFSVVFQDFQLLPLPLGENVAAAKQYDPARAADCLEKAGFSDRLAQMPKGLDTSLYRTFDPEGVEISGGEAQKIALARALYRDAPFIILDEPTAALDPLAEAEVYSKFDQIAGDKTAVYISHRLSSCRFCDDIAVFRQGEVVQKGTHDSLLADAAGTYAALWNAQAQYYTKKAGDSPEEDPA